MAVEKSTSYSRYPADPVINYELPVRFRNEIAGPSLIPDPVNPRANNYCPSIEDSIPAPGGKSVVPSVVCRSYVYDRFDNTYSGFLHVYADGSVNRR